MHILVIDGSHVEAEFRAKFGPKHEYVFFSNANALWPSRKDLVEAGEAAVVVADAIFNFYPDSTQEYVKRKREGVPLFEEASLTGPFYDYSTRTIIEDPHLYGFCGLPTLINRPLLEVSLHDEADRQKLAETCAALGTDYRVVADRVGLVTPRVICQIINEACFTVQEGTATMQDVDLGMKLGTSYPRGPFAWANAIGVERVYAVLEAMWHDTHDERYKVCPLLKRQALWGVPFAL